MQLTTLGGLALKETSFTRVKPLLLLSYLALEGSKERRYVAEFFWPDASDHLNSLSRALSQLRKGTQDAIAADDQRVWTKLQADVHGFLDALNNKDYALAVSLYSGPFLEGVYLQDWGVELEEWVYEQRELLAAKAQSAMLHLAEDYASKGRFTDAANLAETAFELSGAPSPEPETLSRYYRLLIADTHHLASKVKDEAQGYDIALTLRKDEARLKLRSAFIGRDEERSRLEGLSKGQWAWLQGAAGMGKTTLLKSLSGSYLPARSGLPFASLEPLLGQSIEDGEAAILGKLAKAEGTWLIDAWEWMDKESQALIRKLRDMRPNAKVIIASRQAAAFRVDMELDVHPFSQDQLKPYPKLWEKTSGLPVLVGAYLRGEPLEAALESRLSALSEEAKKVYLSLSLLETPDPSLVRHALNIKAKDMAKALETLLEAGLSQSSGQAQAAQAAEEFLEAHPVLLADLSIRIARQLKGRDAYPHYKRARLFWEQEDLKHVTNAYHSWASELIKRGFPQQASDVLKEAPEDGKISFLHARSLERAGRFKEALNELENVQDTADTLALKGALYWRLGLPQEAKGAATEALNGDIEARAEAFNTLGLIARSEGDIKDAEDAFSRASALWLTLGKHARHAGALNNLAITQSKLGKDALATFQQALEAAGDNPLLQAKIHLNLAFHKQAKDSALAKESYKEAASLSEQSGDHATAASAWNNLGVLLHKQNLKSKAKDAYSKALEFARLAGEKRLLGMFMANLAELTEDIAAWEEALRILEEAGHPDEARQYRDELAHDHPFKQSSPSP